MTLSNKMINFILENMETNLRSFIEDYTDMRVWRMVGEYYLFVGDRAFECLK